MNISYIASVTLIDGEAFVDQFQESRLADPEILSLVDRIEVEADPEIDARGPGHRHETFVTIDLVDGTRLEATKLAARGSAARPMERDEVIAKFRRLAAKALPEDAVARVEEAILGFDQLASVDELVEALTVVQG